MSFVCFFEPAGGFYHDRTPFGSFDDAPRGSLLDVLEKNWVSFTFVGFFGDRFAVFLVSDVP